MSFARNLNIYLAVYFSAESHSRIRSTSLSVISSFVRS